MTRARPLVLAVLLLPACETLSDQLEFDETPVPIFRGATLDDVPATPPAALKVMAWNVKYGAGRIDFWFDYYGDRVQMTQAEVGANMDGIYKLIREYDPDVLMTEEIEVNSRRSTYVDMVQGILDNTGLNYGAFFESWNSRYIPNEGLGRMQLGVAIFSKYPITAAKRIKQVERTDQDALTKFFYIRRVLGRAVIDAGGRDVAAWAVHVEAYDTDGTKQAQIKQLHDLLAAESLPWVVGGDLNELPPVCDETIAGDCDGKLKLKEFPDENAPEGDVYEQPPYTPSVLKSWYDDFTPWVTLADYGATPAAQKPFFTHTVLSPDKKGNDGEFGYWNRTLDYLFVRKTDSWTPGSTGVLQKPGDGPAPLAITSDPMRLSDHAPVYGEWRLP